MEAKDLEPPLTLFCSDIHLEMEGYPVEQCAVIEIPLLPLGRQHRLGPARLWHRPGAGVRVGAGDGGGVRAGDRGGGSGSGEVV
jgi:hypothetical protein